MTTAGRALLIVGLLFALTTAGCSFLLGVSEDPVVDAFDASDAGDEDAPPE